MGPITATSFPNHERYFYESLHDVTVDLRAFASLPRELATASSTQHSLIGFFN
jgi:hypothetical protein